MIEEKTRHIYKKVESDSKINIDPMKQETDNDKLTETKTEKDINPYQKVVLYNLYKDDIKTVQMEFWSILSDDIKYIQHDAKTAHILDVKTLDYRKHKKLYNKLKGKEGQMLDIDFGDNPNMLKTNYLDMYEGVHADMVYSNRFDKGSDLSTTYLGRTNMTREPR